MTHSNWPMLEYVPVRGAWERVQYRSIRAARKGMRRVFKERGLEEFVARMELLRKNPRLNGAEKRVVFEGILNDYAAFVTAKQTAHLAGTGEQPVATGEPAQEPVAEAAPVADAGTAVLAMPLSGGEIDSIRDGARLDDGGGVPGLASEDIIEPIIENDL
jgi:hypothetical protein